MAEILYHKIQFTDPNPFGEFVAGDTIELFYDDSVAPPPPFNISSDGVVVYKNGVEILSGADIVTSSEGYKTELAYRPVVCFTTRLVTTSRVQAFPYLYISSYDGHPSCADNGPVCDLAFVGTPVITGASGPAVSDGAITVTASSSNSPIEYRLGSTFYFGDGTGQATGEFTGLAPGQYRIYVRDSVNCVINVLVTVGFTDVSNALYRLEYDDPVGGVTKVDIVQQGYSGSVTQVKGANIGFERGLKGEGSQDKFISILATKATLYLSSETNFAFSGLYTNNPEEFKMNFYKNAVLQGVYKVLPQQYSEDYKASPYYVSVVATDGLPSLKEYVFLQDDGQRFHDSMKAIELIAYILKKTKLELSIRVSINLYATAMNTAATDDPLDQAYVDCDTYYINEAEPTLDYVLRQIIEPFGASIVQENAVWNIVRIEEKRGTYDYREFDFNGAFVSNSSFDPILSVQPVGTPGFHFSDRDHFLQIMPGYGKIRVFYKLGLRENILENGDFRLTSAYSPLFNEYFFDIDSSGFQLINAGYTLRDTWQSVDKNNVAWKIEGSSTVTSGYGNAYIQSDTYNIKMGVANTLKISIRFKLPPAVAYLLTPLPLNVPYQKVRVRVKYGTKYLLNDGTWSTTENFLTIYSTEFDKYIDQEFIATQPDSGARNGYNFDVRVYHSYVYHAEFIDFAGLRGKVTFTSESVLPLGTKSEVSALGTTGKIYYYELEENTSAESEPDIIRPTDYNAGSNPVQWILKESIGKTITNDFVSPFWIDHIKVEFLTSGSAPVDTILREINAEPKNIAVLEKEVTHGSYQSLVTTIPQWDFGIGKLVATSGATLSLITTNVLSADILYAGYFRDSAGVGYSTWSRDGISESASLHAILLQMYAAQYKRSWRKLTGSFYSQSHYFSFLNVLKVVNDSNRLYLPISPTIDDVNNRVRGEFLELTDITAGAGSDGSGTSPFTSGFTTGFGAGYN